MAQVETISWYAAARDSADHWQMDFSRSLYFSLATLSIVGGAAPFGAVTPPCGPVDWSVSLARQLAAAGLPAGARPWQLGAASRAAVDATYCSGYRATLEPLLEALAQARLESRIPWLLLCTLISTETGIRCRLAAQISRQWPAKKGADLIAQLDAGMVLLTRMIAAMDSAAARHYLRLLQSELKPRPLADPGPRFGL